MLPRPETLEETIVVLLKDGGRSSESLLADIRRKKPVTKQGFYAALRKLRRQEVALLHKRTITLNTSWVLAMQDLTSAMGDAYEAGGSDIASLSEGESISYTFKSTHQLDVFWGHTQNLLLKSTPTPEPVYAYDPHYWFFIARPETETALLSNITREGRQFLMTVGGKTSLDISLRKHFKSDLLQYSIRPLFSAKEYYVTVIGDFITEVYLDKAVAKRVEEIYSSNEADPVEKLKELLSVPGRSRMRISRSARRAPTLRAKLGKDFYLQKS